jgi:pimeloyl-ACP methyl ester carboxylesterase
MIEVLELRPAESKDIPRGVTYLSYRSPVDGLEDWALLWPPEHEGTWIVCLHGGGSHGDQLYVRADIRRDWLPEFRSRGFGILTPNLRDDAWMSPAAAEDLRLLLQFVRDKYQADRFVFFTGSMGGTGALIYAVLHPEDVAGLVALCPLTSIVSLYDWSKQPPEATRLHRIAARIDAAYGCKPEEVRKVYDRHSCREHADRLTMPVYLAHGDADDLIPVGESRALTAVLTSGVLKYHEIPGGGHDAPLVRPIVREGLDWVLGGKAPR